MLYSLIPPATVCAWLLSAWQVSACPLQSSENTLSLRLGQPKISHLGIKQARVGRLRRCTNELQQGFAAGGMGIQGSVSLAPALVLHMSLHYHSPPATILGPVHDGNDH